jgi:hypothetical protein
MAERRGRFGRVDRPKIRAPNASSPFKRNQRPLRARRSDVRRSVGTPSLNAPEYFEGSTRNAARSTKKGKPAESPLQLPQALRLKWWVSRSVLQFLSLTVDIQSFRKAPFLSENFSFQHH